MAQQDTTDDGCPLEEGYLRPSHVANARGYEYFKRGAFDEAIKCYNSALATKGDFPEALSNRGAARLQKGDIHGAIRDCSQAVELAPNMVEALCNRDRPYNKREISMKLLKILALLSPKMPILRRLILIVLVPT